MEPLNPKYTPKDPNTSDSNSLGSLNTHESSFHESPKQSNNPNIASTSISLPNATLNFSFFDDFTDLVFILDMETKEFLYLNRACKQFFEDIYSKPFDSIKQSFYELLDSNSSKRLEKYILEIAPPHSIPMECQICNISLLIQPETVFTWKLSIVSIENTKKGIIFQGKPKGDRIKFDNQLLSEQTSIGIFLIQNGLFKIVNDALAKTLGYSVDALLQFSKEDLLDLVYSEDFQNVDFISNAKQNGDQDVPINHSFRVIRSDGKIRWLEVFSKSILYHGKPADFGMILDITKRKNTEDHLKQYQEHLEELVEIRTKELQKDRSFLNKLIDLNPFAIEIKDKDGFYVSSNKAFINLFKKLPPKEYSILNDPYVDSLGYRDAINRAFSGEVLKLYNVQSNYPLDPKTKIHGLNSTNYLDIIIFPIFNDAGNVENVVFMYENTTEKYLAEQKRIETNQLLQKSEQQYRTVVEASNDIVFVANPDRKLTFFNSAATKNLGYSNQELLHLDILNIIHRNDVFRVQQQLENLYDGFSVMDLKARVRTKMGDFIYVSANMSPLYDPDNGFTGFLGVARNITEKVISERIILENQKSFEQIVKLSPQPIALLSDKDHLTFLNQSFIDTFGYTLEDIPTTKSWIALLFKKPSTQQNILERYYKQISKLKKNSVISFDLVFDFPCKDQSIRKVKYRVAKMQSEKLIVFHEDITDQLAAELAIKQSEKQFRSLFNSSHDAIFVMNGLEIVDCNYRAVEMLGYSKEEILHKSPYDLAPTILFNGAPSKSLSEEHLAEIKEKGAIFFEWQFIRKDGSELFVEVHLRHIEGEPDQMHQALMRDITERRFVEEQLKEKELQVQYSSTISMVSSLLIHESEMDASITDGLKTLGNTIGGAFIGIFHQVKTSKKYIHQLKWHWKSKKYLHDISELSGNNLKFLDLYAKDLPMNIYAQINLSNPPKDLTPLMQHGLEVLDLNSLIYIPILIGTQRFGTLIIGDTQSSRNFSHREISMCLQISILIGIALKSESNQEFVHKIFDALSELNSAVFIIQKDDLNNQRFMYINTHFAEMMGMTQAEILHMDSFLEVLAEEEHQNVLALYTAREKGFDFPNHFATVLKTRTGNKPVQVAIAIGELNEKPATFGIIREIKLEGMKNVDEMVKLLKKKEC